MSKYLVPKYNFNPATDTVVIQGIYRRERLLLITNVTTNQTIYTFNDDTQGISSYAIDTSAETTTIALDYDCTAMSSTDKLQIFVELDSVDFSPAETFVDPVSKIRVSQPENLIDTDFEYGLQSTKWETLELVKNIPTFFARNGDEDLSVTEITSIVGSDTISVVTAFEHNLIPGSPIIVQGTKSITANGGFVVTSASTLSFQYKSKSNQNFTGNILDTYTQIFPGSVYQGTEFKLSNISSLTTDAAENSTITVNTEFPTDFSSGTSFFLTNSVSTSIASFDAELSIPENYNVVSVSTTNNTATGETGFALGATQVYTYTGAEQVVYFTNTELTVNATTDAITFSTAHGLVDNRPYLYVVGEGNTAIGGLASYTGYFVRVIDATNIYLTTTRGGTARVNLTTAGVDGGVMRSAFIRAYKAISANTGTTFESIAFDEAHGLSTFQNQPVMFFNGTASNLVASTNLINGFTLYYPHTLRAADSISWSLTSGGAQINLTSATANAYMIKVNLLNERWSMNFENHGLVDNSVVVFTANSGTPPTGIATATTYKIEYVNANRVRFKNNDSGAVIQLTGIGSTNGQFTIETRTPDLNNDSLYVPFNTLTDGSSVTYDENGGTAVGGLVDGDTYYIFQRTSDRIKLATTAVGWKTAASSVNQATGVNTTTNVITTQAAHGFTTGDAVQYLSTTPVSGLVNGAWYWVRSVAAGTCSLHWSKAGAIANSDIVDLAPTPSGTGTLRTANLVDITSTGIGTQKLSSISIGGSDGVYNIVSKTGDNSFTLLSNTEIPAREILVANPTQYIDLSRSAIQSVDHFMTTGTPVVFTTTGSAPGGLTATNTYHIIRINRDWFKLAATFQEAVDNNAITLTSAGSGSHSFTTTSISGEVLGPGTFSVTAESTVVSGLNTNFSSTFSPGDTFVMYIPETLVTKSVSSVDTTTNVFTSAVHGLADGAPLKMASAVAPTGTTNGVIYYARITGRSVPANEFTLHPTYDDAIAGTNTIDVTTAGTTVALSYISSVGSTVEKEIRYVNSKTNLVLREAPGVAFTSAEYAVGTALLIRADGFALHRPYDGGVELVPSTNPDSTMIRQTRKYFRYQSGKGIQVSFAVNFSPTTTFDTLSVDPNSNDFLTATGTTRYPHRLTVGLPITVSGVTGSDADAFNGVHIVTAIVDDFTFSYGLDVAPNNLDAPGLAEYHVNSWQNSKLKCGLFDDQNGLFFEYDGQQLYCVRRSSTLQLSGTVSVSFKSGMVVGTNTKFSSQLQQGDKIVIKGQTYLITKISSNTLLYILPSYRGVDATNVIITKTVDTKVPQTDWSIDPCDGTGPLGFVINPNRIQMAYMDYSWYGAGKVRFGFKDQSGKVIYVHEFIHNNKQTEAYMRSGNLPARYEIENTGAPTYVPALAHWGTSVIMDGRFDDDKAYVFTANSNTLSIVGAATQTVSARVETQSQYQLWTGTQARQVGFALLVATPNSQFNSISNGLTIAGTGLAANTVTANPQDRNISPRQPYLASVDSFIGGNFGTRAARTLLVLDRQPTTVAASATNYTVTLSAAATPVVYDIPLISIRLAPSVDTNTPGYLGEREIINRMQLILNSVGVLSTHSAEITLLLNGQINNNSYERVTNPSLSQLIYHSTSDTISGGTVVYSFRAGGGTGATARTPVVTSADLGDIATLGNSIMGGDGTFPDGPDVLTVVARLIEDPSTVSSSNPFNITGRISWSESQA